MKEVEYLLSKGVRYGENGIKHTTSRHTGKKYYLCESGRNLKILNEYREKLIG